MGLLDALERAGNRLPDPIVLFCGICAVVAGASAVAEHLDAAVTHPGTGETVRAVSLLDAAGLRRMLTEAVRNFTSFPPLGLVLVMVAGVGLCERTGLFAALLRGGVSRVPSAWLPAAVMFAGVNASLAADAAFVVLLPLAAMVYAGAGRHPLAGLAAAFAGVSGGYSANLLVTSLDPLLSGLTEQAARAVDPGAVVPPTCNWWFMIASTFLLTGVGALVTTRIVEPRLGAWAGERPNGAALTTTEQRGILGAGVAAVLVLALAGVAVATGVLRDGDSLKPFYDALIVVLAIAFAAAGVTYGVVTGTVRSSHEVAKLAAESLATMGGYILLALVAAQFVAWFAWSNLGVILAVKGAEALRDAGFGGVPLLVAFVLFSAGVDLLVASASAKWAVMAPVFVPMLMLVGVPPEVTQAAYRVGDSVANVITPMMPYFPLVIAVAVKYDPRAGLGTLLATMVPYSLAFLVAWSVLLGAWYALGLPFGPGV